MHWKVNKRGFVFGVSTEWTRFVLQAYYTASLALHSAEALIASFAETGKS